MLFRSQWSVGNRSYTAVWKEGTNTPYKVIHVKQGLDGLYHSWDTTLTETENKTWKTNNSVTGYRKSYVGFITPAEQETARIEADWSTVIEYDYARRTFKYTLNTDVTWANVLWSTTSNDEMFYEAPIVLSWDKEIGYTWSGWNIISWTKHIFIADNQTGFIMPLNNVEVTPVVIHNQWRLSYDVNGGTGDGLEEQFPRYYDDEIVLPVPTREGYDFSGWYDEDMHYYTWTIHMPDADLALKAYWNAKPFVLNVSHYKMNLSGTYEDVEPEVVTMDVHLDDDNVTWVVKEYTGFTLSWDEQVIHIATDGSSKIDYYYERDKHAVSVVLATGVVLSEESTQSGEYFFETPIMLEASVQTWYTWSGWKVNDEELDTNTGISFDLWTGDVMLEAFATPNTYRAVFKNDTGDVILDEEVVFGEVIPLPTESLTKTGYIFWGWRNLPADGRMSAWDLELTPIWNTPSSGNTGGGWGGSSGSSRSSSSSVTSSSNPALTSTDEQANNDKYVAGEESSFQASKYSGVELSRGNLARMVTILIDLFPRLVEGKEVVNGEECNEYADEGLFTKKERDAVARLCSIGVMWVHNDTKKPIPSFESRKKATENEFALVMRRLLVDFHEEETNSVIEKYLWKEEVLHFGAVYDIAYALKHLLEKK